MGCEGVGEGEMEGRMVVLCWGWTGGRPVLAVYVFIFGGRGNGRRGSVFLSCLGFVCFVCVGRCC